MRILPTHIENYLTQLNSRGLSPATLDRKRSALNKFLGWAQDKGYIPNPPLNQTISESIKKPEADTIIIPAQITPETPPTSPKKKRKALVSLLVGAVIILALLLLNRQTQVFRLLTTLAKPLTTPLTGPATGGAGEPAEAPRIPPTAPPAVTAPNWILFFKGKVISGREEVKQAGSLQFSLYSEVSGGTPLWTSKTWQLAPTAEGEFVARLGDTNQNDTPLPQDLFFKHEYLYLGIRYAPESSRLAGATEATPRQKVSTAANVINSLKLQGHEPAEEANVGNVPVIDSGGALVLASQNPAVIAKTGTFKIQGQAITLTTPPFSQGDITLTPDAGGTIKLYTSGTGGAQIEARNANLQSGSLISGTVANDSTGYNLLQLSSGSTPADRFVVDSLGNTNIGGVLSVSEIKSPNTNLQIDNNLFFPRNDATLSAANGLEIKTTSGNLTLSPNGVLNVTSKIQNPGTNNDGRIYLEDTTQIAGHLFTRGIDADGKVTLNRDLVVGNQTQLGRYSANPTAIGAGSLIYNTGDNTVYVWNGTSWNPVGGGSATGFWQRNSQALSPYNITDDVLLGATATSSALVKFTGTSGGNSWINTGNFGIGTTSPVGKLDVSGAVTGKALVILDETGDQNILTASASGTTVANLDRSGNLAVEGQLSDLSGATLTINDALSVLGAVTVTGVISDSDSNLILDDTTDIGSATTGIRIATSGDISDIDGNVSISDNTDITGNLDVSGTLTSGTANAFTVDASGNITTAGDLAVNGGDITTTATTFNLINATTTTLNIGGAATSLSLGASTGTTTINNATTAITGNLDVNGTTNDIAGTLNLSGNTLTSSGDLTINPTGGQVLLSDTSTLIIGGHAGNVAYNVIGNAADAPDEAAIAADNDLYIGGDLEVDGVIYGTVSGAAGNVAWSNLTNPSANLSLSHNEYTTTFTWDTASNAASLDALTLALTNDATTDGGNQRLLVLANNDASGTTGVTERLLVLDNKDTDEAVTTALEILASSTGTITTAIDVSDAEIGTALSAGANDLTGTNWSITGSSGNIATSGDLAVNGATSADITSTTTTASLFDATVTTLNIGSAVTTLNLGDAATTKTIDIGGVTSSGTDTINIATNATAADTITIGNTAASTATTISGGTINLTTDSTGNAEIVLPNDAVGPNEIYTTGQTDEYCLTYEATGTTWEWQTCGGGSSAWSALTNPTADLTLTMAAYNTTFNWDPGADTTETNFTLTTQGEDTTGTGDQDQVLLALSQTANGVNVDEAADALLTLANADADDPVENAIRFDVGGAGTDFTYGLNFDAADFTTEIVLENAETIANQTNGTITLGAESGALTLSLSGTAASVTNTSGNLTIDSAGTLVINDNLDLSNAAKTVTLANVADALNFDSNTLSIDALNNRVGIGTTGPTTKLEVAAGAGAGMLVSGAGTNGMRITPSADSNNTIFNVTNAANNVNWLTVNANGQVIMNGTGNVGIGDTTPAATLTVGSGDLFQVTGATGNITTAGDLAVNGGDITSTSTTFNLLNSTVTTLNIGGAATTVSLGAATGTTTINNATLAVTGVLDVNGAGTSDIAGTLNLSGNTLTSTGDLTINAGDGDVASDDRWTVGSQTPGVGKLTVTGAEVGKALAIFDETGDQNILTASASGTTVANLTRTGDLELKGQGDLRLYDSDNSNYTGFQAPALTSDLLMTLPSDAGASGYALTTNGSGTLSWATVGGGGVTPDSLDFTEFKDTLTLDANLTLNQGTYTWTQNFDGTTTTGLTYNANSLTSGTALVVASTATGMTGDLTTITLSGSNAANTGSLLSLTNSGTANTNTTFYIKHYATGTNNLAMRVDDVLGDTTPFVIDGTGNVGIGTTTPASALSVTTSGRAAYGQAAAIFDHYENQDLITASASGATRFYVSNTGDAVSGRFVDLANTSYYLDPANSTTSLLTAGAAGIGVTSASQKLTVQQDNVADILGLYDGANNTSLLLADAGVLTLKPTAFDTVYNFDGGTTYTDNTTEAKTSGGTAFTVLALEASSNDELYLGLDHKFATVYFDIATAGAGVTLSAQYYNGATWSALTITDGTTNLTADGTVTFTAPSDWATTSVNGVTKYWIRLRSPTTNITTAPTANSVSPTTGNRFYAYAQAGDSNPALYINDQGNVGIGTTSPRAKLDLGLLGGSVLVINPGSATSPSYAGFFHHDLILGSYVSGGYSQGFISTGYTADPNRKFHIGSASNPAFDGTTTFVPALTVMSGGNVGIGTTSPGATLDVNGVIRAYRSSTTTQREINIGVDTNNRAVIYQPANSNELRFFIADPTWGGVDYMTLKAGNVGIGTTGPDSPLDILDVIRAGVTYSERTPTRSASYLDVGGLSFVGNWPRILFNSYFDGTNYKYTSSDAAFQISQDITNDYLGFQYAISGTAGNNGTFNTGMVMDTSGNVGIGNASPVGKLDVSGAVTGKALVIFNETGDQNIFTASASGATRFNIQRDGDIESQRFVDIADNTYYLDPANTGTSLNTAGQITVAGGGGKIDVGTVDPPYTIEGGRYATYMAAMTGLKEETTGVVETSELVDGVGYRAVIDFGNQAVGSDLWLFSRATDLVQNMNNLVVLLNPEGLTQAWYDLDVANFKLAIYTSRPTRVSYRLTAPRFDSSRWTNRRASSHVGFNLDGVVSPIPTDTAPLATPSSDGLAEVELISSSTSSLLYSLQTALGEVIYNVGLFSQAAIANLRAGIIESQEVISQIGQIRQIRVETISPIASDSAGIAVRLGPTQTFGIYNEEGTPAATFDSEGNATFSGTLYADRIVTRLGDFETIRTSTVAANFITNVTNVTNIFNSTPSAEVRSPAPDATSSALISLLQNENLDSLTFDTVTLPKNLSVLGNATLGATAIAGSLMIDGSVRINTDGIEAVGATLYLQKNRLADLDIMNGALLVNTLGNVTINGSLAVTGDVVVGGTLSAQTISPLPDTDLTINLVNPPLATSSATASGQLATTFGQLLIKGSEGATVASFDASGNATFSGELTTNKLVIAAAAASASQSGEINSNATIGTGTLPSGTTEVTIATAKVTPNSFIYITPITTTNNRVLYLKSKTASSGFVVGTDQPISHDVQFNWWIIN